MQAAKQLASALDSAASRDLGSGARSSSFEVVGYGGGLFGHGLSALGFGMGVTGRIGFFHAGNGGEITVGAAGMMGIGLDSLASFINAAGMDPNDPAQPAPPPSDATVGVSATADIAYVYYWHATGIGLGARASYVDMSDSTKNIDVSAQGLSAGVVVSIYATRSLEDEVQFRFHHYPATTGGTSSDTGLEACFGVNGFVLALGANQLIDGSAALFLSVGLRDVSRAGSSDY
jgi:hypothetical protein